MMEDNVNKPNHYMIGNTELDVHDIIEQNFGKEFMEHLMVGSAIEYLMRYNKKGKPIEDLKKARYEIDKAISCLEAGNE